MAQALMQCPGRALLTCSHRQPPPLIASTSAAGIRTFRSSGIATTAASSVGRVPTAPAWCRRSETTRCRSAAPSSTDPPPEPTGSGQPVVEASAVMEPGPSTSGQGEEEGEAGAEYNGDEYEALVEQLIPRAPLSVVASAVRGYALLAAAHAGVGLALMACAVAAPQLLLSECSFTGGSRVLLGCLGAAALRTAALLAFLTDSMLSNELCTWRHQRLNLLLGLAAATAALTQLGALLHSAPLMSVAVLGLSLPTTLLCGWAFREGLACGENFSWAIDWTRPAYTFKHLSSCLGRDLSTLPGLLLLLMVGLQAAGFLQLLVSGLSPHTLHTVFTFDLQASWAIRQVSGSGLLLFAAAAHCLLDFAPWTARLSSPGLAREAVLSDLISRDRLQAAMRPPRERFTALNVALLLAAAAQAYFLFQIHPWGAQVNLDTSLWGPLFAGTLLSALYCPALALSAGWEHLVELGSWALAAAMALGAWLVDKFLYPWEWQLRAQR